MRKRWLCMAAMGTMAYARLVRPWHLRWGATDAEVREALPGDKLVPEPQIQSTRAITIDAPVDAVWPWLVQIGQNRAGFYSYTWLENLFFTRMRNAEQLVPEWQHMEVGDMVWLHPRVALEVRLVEPGRALVLGDTWGLYLRPIDAGRTRLIVRGRGQMVNPDLGPVGNFLFWRLLFEPAHFVMERGMMRGLKKRAERAQAVPEPIEPAAMAEL